MEIGIFISFIAIAILLVLSAFFSGSETALTAASKERLHALAKEGDRRAIRVAKILAKKDRMIGALLLGNNMVNILASALATSMLIGLFGEAGVVYATLMMTLLVLIFSEVLPKTYALHHAESVSMRISSIIHVVIIVFAPVTEAVTWVVRGILKMFGVDISKVAAGSHLELLRGAIDMHDADDEEVQAQRAMLRSILDLVEVDVEEIMIHRRSVSMIDADWPIDKIIELVLDSPYSRMPLWKGKQDNIIGIVHVKWLLRELKKCDGDTSKLDIEKVCMETWYIPETTTLYDQLQAFRDRKEHFAIVIDEYGSFMGIVTLEDILEEIVGQIDDEHDVRVPGVKQLQNGSFMINGTVTIRDLNREFGWELPDEEYATIAGLILFESEMIPAAGQSFSFYDFRFDIVKRQRNQITMIKLTPPSTPKGGAL